jgi:hypothetical protein
MGEDDEERVAKVTFADEEEPEDEDAGWEDWCSTTFLLLNFTSLVEAADLTVLPAVFEEVGSFA